MKCKGLRAVVVVASGVVVVAAGDVVAAGVVVVTAARMRMELQLCFIQRYMGLVGSYRLQIELMT